jgi:predicted TIM-barrel fold metal-dependent hydrolase
MPTQTEDLIAGLKVIDADTHLSEPPDLWLSRAPASLRDRVPQRKVIDGELRWVIDGDFFLGFRGAGSVIKRDGSKARDLRFSNWQVEDVHEGCFDVKARLAFMDQEGIWAQIIYPNILGFGGQAAAKVDPELRLAATQIYNDALAEMQETSGQRLFGMALLPWWDIKLATAEVERCAAMGLRGVNTNSDPHGHGLPDLAEPYWDPLWEVCSHYDLPINFHIGASDESMSWFGNSCWPSQPSQGKMIIGGAMICMANARVLGNIIISGLLDRYPKLKFVSVESGIGWIPFMLRSFEYQIAENAPPPGRELKLTPKEYFQRNMYGCFWFENEDLEPLIRRVGVDNVLFETDFPHPTCLYPDSLGRAREALAGADRELVGKVLSKNAARVYNIDIGSA